MTHHLKRQARYDLVRAKMDELGFPAVSLYINDFILSLAIYGIDETMLHMARIAKNNNYQPKNKITISPE